MLLFTVIILLGFLCFTFLKVDKAFDYCREFISVPERNVRFEVCNYFCFIRSSCFISKQSVFLDFLADIFFLTLGFLFREYSRNLSARISSTM